MAVTKVTTQQVDAAKTSLMSEARTQKLYSETNKDGWLVWFAKTPLIGRLFNMYITSQDKPIQDANAKVAKESFTENLSKYSTALGKAAETADKIPSRLVRQIQDARTNLAQRVVALVSNMGDSQKAEARAMIEAAKQQVASECETAELTTAEQKAQVAKLMAKIREEAVSKWVGGFDATQADVSVRKAIDEEAANLVSRGIFDTKSDAVKALKQAWDESVRDAGKKAVEKQTKEMLDESNFDVAGRMEKEEEALNKLKEERSEIEKLPEDDDGDDDADEVETRTLRKGGWEINFAKGALRDASKALIDAQIERDKCAKALQKKKIRQFDVSVFLKDLKIVPRKVEDGEITNPREASPTAKTAKELKLALKKVRAEIEKNSRFTNETIDALLAAQEEFIEKLQDVEKLKKERNKLDGKIDQKQAKVFGGHSSDDDRAWDAVEAQMKAERAETAEEMMNAAGQTSSKGGSTRRKLYREIENIKEARNLVRNADWNAIKEAAAPAAEARDDDDEDSVTSSDDGDEQTNKALAPVASALRKIPNFLEAIAEEIGVENGDEVLENLGGRNTAKRDQARQAIRHSLNQFQRAAEKALESTYAKKEKVKAKKSSALAKI